MTDKAMPHKYERLQVTRIVRRMIEDSENQILATVTGDKKAEPRQVKLRGDHSRHVRRRIFDA